MNKPIYRHLADKEWRKYKRNLLIQRVTQMNVIPDVLPSLDPVVSVDLAFGNRAVQPGEFVDSRVSEIPARLNVQVYDKGERYISVAVVNPDVPNVEKDAFDYRCHFLACNIKISPTSGNVPLHQLAADSQIVLPWLPAYTQKGAPYNRMSVFVLEQQPGQLIDAKALQEKTRRDGFILRSFVDRHSLKPVGVNLFRSQFDEGTAGVMQRAGIPGHDVEFKRKKIEPLPYKKLPGSRYR
jgi:large subunit ribosomal protein L35